MHDDKTLPMPGDDPSSPRASNPGAVPGAQLGPYTLVELIGAGGMGDVWKAEQSSPIQRTVALKLIRAGMDSREVLARFEAERQALALMDHPCIARVFDAGTTPQGHPFFAMEYVHGVAITEYCDSRRLDTRARIELFQKVCYAVQHAHQKAMLHRDLKPSNILVADVDGQPMPKIIDFGLAKAMTRTLNDGTAFTSIGQILGTPEYMSPEQAELTNEDVDTRSDVYSLGVVLYELLVGVLPVDSAELRRGGLEAMLRILREKEPPKPSARLSTLGDKAAPVAQSRHTEAKRLSSQIRGDLDWIVMRAMEKDRNRRYGSPAEFAQDLQRHLGNEPVVASPPSAGYRTSKFIRRHRAGVAVTSGAVLALIAFAVISTIQARIIARERDRATAEAAKATAMNDFLTRTLASADPWGGGSRNVTVVQTLDAAANEVGKTFAQQPEVEASMRKVLGEAYLGLGQLKPASEQINRAKALYDGSGQLDPRAMSSLRILESRLAQQENDFGAAVDASTAAVKVLDKDPSTPLVVRVGALEHLTRSLLLAQRYAEADSVLSVSESLAQGLKGKDRFHIAEITSERADLLNSRDGNAAAADSLSRRAYELGRAIDPDDPHLGNYMNNAAQYRSQTGDFQGALADFDTALVLYKKSFGTDHPEYATCVENRGGVLYQMGRADETLKALELAYDIRARNLGPDHIDAIRTRLNVGAVAMLTGDNERALKVYRELEPRLIAARGTDHPDVLVLFRNEGIALRGLHRPDEALALFDRVLKTSRRMYGDNDPRTARALADRGAVLIDLKRYDESRTQLTAAFETFLAQYGATNPQTRVTAKQLVGLFERTGDEQAAAKYRKYTSQ